MLGHRAKKSEVGLAQGPEPPIQFWKPVSIKWMPMSMTEHTSDADSHGFSRFGGLPVGPVTMGGKMRSITFGGIKEMAISIRAQRALEPMMASLCQLNQ